MTTDGERNQGSSVGSRLFSLPSALGCFAVLYSWTLTYPLNIDSSVHAYMASLLLKGYWPYVAVWENNFPGTMLFVHLPELLLFGKSAFGFHLWDLLWQVTGAFFLYRLVERSVSQRAAWLAVLFMAVYYLSLDNLFVGQRDGFATISLLATLWLLRKSDGWIETLLAGLCCGIAILIRPTNEIYIAAIVFIILLNFRRRESWFRSAVFAVSAQMWLVLFIVYYLSRGWYSEFYTIVFRFNTEVYAHTQPLATLLYPFPHYWIFAIGAIVGLFVWKFKDSKSIILLLIASLISIYPQKRYLYQYHTTFIFLIWLSVAGWDWVITRIDERWRDKRRVVGIALTVLLALSSLLLLTRGTAQKRIALRALTGRLPGGPIRWMYDDSKMSGYEVLDSLSDYLSQHTPTNERVQLIGEYAYPLFEAGVLPATRFITFHSVMIRGASGKLTSYQERWRSEILQALLSGTATYVVVADAPEYARGHLNGLLGHEILKRDFTALGDAIISNYHLEQTIGAFSIYRVNEESIR